MSGPDFGTAIIRLAILATGIILLVTPGPQIQKIIAAMLFAWLAASAVAPHLRHSFIRLRQRGLQRRGDGWMSDAARAKTADWRAYCQQQAAKAYEQAREWDRVR